MALPAGISTGTFAASYTNPDGTPATGSIVFTPVDLIVIPATPNAVVPEPVTVQLTAGAMTKTLPATDYRVDFRLSAFTRSILVRLPANTTLNLPNAAELEPVDELQPRVISVAGVKVDAYGNVPLRAIDLGVTGASGDPITAESIGALTKALADTLYEPKGAIGPATSPNFDPVAVRYGCKAISLHPHDVSAVNPQTIGLVDRRLYVFWLPLPVGTSVSGVRLPVADIATGSAGAVTFTVYQDDLTKLGDTGDVRAALSIGAPNAWRQLPLTASVSTTGPGVWVTAHSTMPEGAPKVFFVNTGPSPELPAWLLNPLGKKTCVRIEGVNTPPATLSLTGSFDYIDFLIGVY